MLDDFELVALKITAIGRDTQLTSAIADTLSGLSESTPKDVAEILQTGPLILNNVTLDRDSRALIHALRKHGFKVGIIPLRGKILLKEAADTSKPRGTAPSKGDVRKHSVEMTWKKGEVIEGLYEVLGAAAGGMGTVYFVYHRVWRMMMAIKTPQAHVVQNKANLARFMREAEIWVDLGLHPNIATCYYARLIEGLPRLFIEYVDGGSLEDYIEKGEIKDYHTLIDLMLQFCHGMIYAEQRGMIHRDIKPANCLLTKDGILKITDFGLVKKLEDKTVETTPMNGDTSIRVSQDVGLTAMQGGIMGSPWYMAPERFSSKRKQDIRSDIYSLGVMIYQAAVNRLPFDFTEGFSLRGLVKKHVSEPPVDPLSVRPDLPRGLVDLIMTCLAKKPDDRYSSFTDVCTALEKLSKQTYPKKKLRKPPNLFGLKADSLNNQAVSLLDLGRRKEATELLEDAHSADTDHLQAKYNLYALRWEEGVMSDLEVVNGLESLKIEVRQTADFYHFMGLIYLQRGDASRALRLLNYAARHNVHYRDHWKALGGDPETFVNSIGIRPVMERTSLGGHIKGVRALRLSADSKTAYSVGEDRSIRVWDLSSGRCLRNIRTFGFSPIAGEISRDCKIAAVGYGDAYRTIDLWDVSRGRSLKKLQFAAYALAFSSDARLLAAGGEDGSIRVYDIGSDDIVLDLPNSGTAVTTLLFIHDNRGILVGRDDGSLTILSATDGRVLLEISAHDGPVTTAETSHDGVILVSGGIDEIIKFWDARTGEELQSLTGHRHAPVSVGFLPGNKFVMTASRDNTVKIWSYETGRCFRTVARRDETLTLCALSPNGDRLVIGESNGRIRVLSVDVGWFTRDFLAPAPCRPKTFDELSKQHRAFRAAVDAFNSAWRQGDHREALRGFDKVRRAAGFSWSREGILIRNLIHGVSKREKLNGTTFIRSLPGHDSSADCLSVSQDGLMLITGGSDGTAAVWDIVSGRCSRRLRTGAPVKHVCLLKRRKGLITWSDDRVLRKWDMNGNLIRELPEVCAPILFADEDNEIVALSPDYRVQRISADDFQPETSGPTLGEHRFVCFGRTREHAYSIHGGTLIQRWSTTTARIVGAFRDLGISITAIKPSPDESRVIAGLENGEITEYIVGSGYNVTTLRGHTDLVQALDSFTDGNLWVSGSDDYSVRLWDLRTGEELAVMEGHSSPITAVRFFPNASMIASGAADGSVRLWGLEWEFS